MNPYIKTKNGRVSELMITVLILQEGDYYVAYCPSLNLSSYGDSMKDAKEGFDETLQDYLQSESFHEDLLNIGWSFVHEKITPPDEVDLNIPAGILRKQFNETVAVC